MSFGLTCLVVIALAAVVLGLLRARRSRRPGGRGAADDLERLRRLEHARVSSELHDSLLQGLHGLIWKFQALSERLPQSHPVRSGMDEALKGADRVLVEGRDRVLDLRAGDDGEISLLDQLTRAVEEIALDPATHFTATSTGDELELMPRVHSEVIAIAADALRRAYRHAGARHIALGLSFEATALRVRIAHDGAEPPREDGAGAAAPGSGSLAGMHERAVAIRAELRVAQGAARGGAVELCVPGGVAYGPAPRRRAPPAGRGDL